MPLLDPKELEVHLSDFQPHHLEGFAAPKKHLYEFMPLSVTIVVKAMAHTADWDIGDSGLAAAFRHVAQTPWGGPVDVQATAAVQGLVLANIMAGSCPAVTAILPNVWHTTARLDKAVWDAVNPAFPFPIQGYVNAEKQLACDWSIGQIAVLNAQVWG